MIGPSTKRKNSGILRYTFGDGGQFGPLVPGAPVIFNCLGSDLDVSPDSDDHVFGPSPGHAAIPNGLGMFAANNLPARAPGPVGPPNGPPFAASAGQRPSAYVPGGTKVSTWFEASQYSPFPPVAAADVPVVNVQTRIIENGVTDAAGVNPTGAPSLSSVQAAVQVFGAGGVEVAGVLYVRLEHSFEDIPGDAAQNTPLLPIQ